MLGIWHEGEWLKRDFGSTTLRSGGTWKSHTGFGFCIINEMLFILVFLGVLWWIICGVYGCGFIDISVSIMVIMYVFYDNNHV